MTLLRLSILFLSLTIIAMCAAWLSESPGSVTIYWLDYRIDTSFAVLMLLLTGIFLILAGALWFYRAIIQAPKKWKESRKLKRQEDGLHALTEAFSAMALADYSHARKQTEKASGLLNNAPLALMFSAQLARMEGNDEKTRFYLEQLAGDPQTAFIAMRGLLDASRQRRDWDAAQHYAQKAYALKPKNKWAVLSLVDIFSHQRKWQEATQIVERAYKKRVIGYDEFRRLWALIHYQHGKKLMEQNDWHNAQSFLNLAHKKAPDFVPAAVLLAKNHARDGKKDAAARILQQTWKLSPHPDLYETFKAIFADEPADTRLKRVEKAIAAQPDNIENFLALGDAQMHAKKLPQARATLEKAYALEHSMRVCRIMAECCQRDASQPEASEWLMKAGTAQAGPCWNCSECGHVAAEWHMHCEACNAFDSLRWNRKHVPQQLVKAA